MCRNIRPLFNFDTPATDEEIRAAALQQRKAELENIQVRVKADVRTALLDVDATANQVRVSDESRRFAGENVRLTRQRYEAGVTDILEVLQAQGTAANGEFDYITSVFAHNVAKLTLARVLGRAEESYATYLNLH